ncbi:MAG: hypothetical protein KDA20_13000 [Phycisphaerales bacterium]|nr:hypothetical protein [Phycisphaerales bacterium]
MNLKSTVVAALALFAGAPVVMATSFPGNPADMYLLSDAASEVYQYERTSPWAYVPGTYAGSAMPMVFSNSAQLGANSPYLGAAAGTNQDFFIGGFNGLTRIDANTGAFVSTIGAGVRVGPAAAPNGNIVVGGPGGIEEYNANTGAFVRNVNSYGNGYNIFCFNGNNMFATSWGGTTIKQYDFVTGLSSGPDIPVPFGAQKLAIGPDGALYSAALYESPTYEGVYRFNGSSWSLFADTQPQSGGGPHAFAWDPISLDLFVSQNTGEIFRYNGITGAFLNHIDTVPTKLTDILFKTTVPAPGAVSMLLLGGTVALRRRR